MKKIIFLMVDYLNVLLNRKNVISVMVMAVLINVLCLTGSGVIGFESVDYKEQLSCTLNSYYNYYFTFSNLVVIITSVLVNVISLNKILNDNSVYMILTGGVKRSYVILGQISGICISNICIYLLVWSVNTIMVIAFQLGNIDMGVFINTMWGCCNSILITLFALLIVIVSKSMALSFAPVVVYVGYNLYFNNSVIQSGEVATFYKIANAIFPVFTIKKVFPEELVNVLYTYKVTNQLQVYYGLPYFVLYLITIIFICVIIYDRADL